MTRTSTLGRPRSCWSHWHSVRRPPPTRCARTRRPEDCGTYTIDHDAVLTVTTPARGAVSSDTGGINCPGVCSHNYQYSDFCIERPGRTTASPASRPT